MLIINSDDFGINSSTNKAIVSSILAGLCSSTTLMTNMPGFEEACSLVHEHRLQRHIGLHLVLRDGVPLTREIQKYKRFCDQEGRLRLDASPTVFTLETSERLALATEVRAQINRCRAEGIPLTHMDSHYHLHNLWPILDVVISVALSERIQYVRLARNCGGEIGLKKRVYKALVNNKLRRAGLTRTTYFGNLADYLFMQRHRPLDCRQPFEIMIHAIIHEAGFLADAGDNQPLQDRMKDVQLFSQPRSFAGAQYRG